MASPIAEDDVFEAMLKKADPKAQEEREKAINDRLQAQYAQAQRNLLDLIGSNSTLPVTINSIKVLGATRTRKAFLDRLFSPILSQNNEPPYTLQEALDKVSSTTDRLRQLDIYKDPISVFIDRPSPSGASSTASDIDVYLTVAEKSRITLKTGTDLGNTEGSAYGNLLLRNVFGGAESLSLSASTGTRTRSAYLATFSSPILSNPTLRFSLDAFSSSTQKPWASHEESLTGGCAKFLFATGEGSKHEIAYHNIWRQVTNLSANASPSVRIDAGDSNKSSLTHTFMKDARNHPLLPSRGYMMRTVSELAGWGPLTGDVSFLKSTAEASGAVPIMGTDSGISLTAGLRAGVMVPLPLGFSSSGAQPSRINDRFTLGGPTDVRGFKQAGLGPRDGPDALGGDVFCAGSANLLLPVPRAGKDTPLRFQIFANGGRLLALNNDGGEKDEGQGALNGKQVRNALMGTMKELGNGLPSLSAGVGLVYAHPVARFELNFALPVVVRKGEEARKGAQFGVGVDFL